MKPRKTGAIRRSTFASDLRDGIFDDDQNAPPAEAPPGGPVHLRAATAGRTRARTRNITLPPEAAEKLSAIHAIGAKDTISNREAARRAREGASRNAAGRGVEPGVPGTDLVRAEDLPSVLNPQIVGGGAVSPEWHQVKHLPGYLKSPIRALGRELFGSFTDTPLEEIQVLADLGGRGPNRKRELAAAAGWLSQNGVTDSTALIDFQKSIPDYQAEMVLQRARGFSFLLVRDFAGHYIYAWPSADERAVRDDARERLQ